MRAYLKLTKNTERCPFNYQGHLVQRFHSWLGDNELHDGISLYSLSWLTRGKAVKNGLDFRTGSDWFISAYDPNVIKQVIRGIQRDPKVAFGMKVESITLQNTPNFGTEKRFMVGSPVFLRQKLESRYQYYFYNDAEAEALLTQSLRTKLNLAGIDASATVQFDSSFLHPKIKAIQYKGIGKKGSVCPVILAGDPEAISFAWDVGIGSGTGIGFGSLI